MYHPIGTSAMGNDDSDDASRCPSVVDPKLR